MNTSGFFVLSHAKSDILNLSLISHQSEKNKFELKTGFLL